MLLRHDEPMPEQWTSPAAQQRFPVHGYPLPVRLPDRDVVLRWGPDEHGTDVVAVEGGRPLVWATVEACLTDVRARGLSRVGDEDDTEPEVMDVRPVAAWLRGEQLSLDPVAALGLWNLAGDIAESVDAPWGDEGRTADRCHAKLTAANIPWLVGAEQYTPRWTPFELRLLRRRLLAAAALLRIWLTT